MHFIVYIQSKFKYIYLFIFPVRIAKRLESKRNITSMRAAQNGTATITNGVTTRAYAAAVAANAQISANLHSSAC